MTQHGRYGYATHASSWGSATMDSHYAPPRLTRDVRRRWVAGVLAGAAQHFGWNLVALRFIVIIAMLTPPLLPAIIVAYVLAALFIPANHQLPPPAPMAAPEPLANRAPTADELRWRLREMEDRLRAMEAYVTSAQYEIDRELREKR
jgi:phage shock protein C